MNILDRIVAFKKEEIAANKKLLTAAQLMQQPMFSRPVLSLKQNLLDEKGTGIIAEFKRRSPSKGVINDSVDVMAVTKAYTENGAACLSVLTDEHFFGGSASDLQLARQNPIPILRKDFIVDEYQLVEARAMGADVILLIAACLTPQLVQELAFFAKSIGLEVLLEIHGEEEMAHICAAVDFVGVNNRNLKTFSVDINRSIALSKQIPAGKLKIAESGISDPMTIQVLKENGFSGFLIGEHFMKETDPGSAFKQFVQQLKQKTI